MKTLSINTNHPVNFTEQRIGLENEKDFFLKNYRTICNAEWVSEKRIQTQMGQKIFFRKLLFTASCLILSVHDSVKTTSTSSLFLLLGKALNRIRDLGVMGCYVCVIREGKLPSMEIQFLSRNSSKHLFHKALCPLEILVPFRIRLVDTHGHRVLTK